MLDVFCCALGCVTLLWLVNQREAKLQARDASGALQSLEVARRDLERRQDELSAGRDERDRLADSVKQLQRAYDTATAELALLGRELATATNRADTADKRVGALETDVQTLTRARDTAQASATDLAERLRSELARLTTAEARAGDLMTQLQASQSAASEIEKQAALVPALQKSAAEADEKLAANLAQMRSISGELETARRALAGVDVEKQDLARRLARAQLAVENRFEGIALTGRRVVFLVDMSGSMELRDDRTIAPEKWAGVRATLLKLFKSLPDLDKFQVILFSDTVSFPLGNEGRWLDPDPRSVERIEAALSAAKPRGNTNMHAGMEATFRYRAQGLDTVYLLSDGLPNVGVGLTPEQAARMTESQRGEVLGRVIRTTLKSTWNAPQPGTASVKINSVGFFYESPEVGAFLWALSREHAGSFVGMSQP